MTRILFVAVMVMVAAGTSFMAQAPQPPGKFRRHVGERRPNHYIVVLRDGDVRVDGVARVVEELTRTHRGERGHVYTHALRGFSARLSETDALRLSLDPRVAYVEEDGVTQATAVQTSPRNWGLDRIDQRSLPLDSAYQYFADGTGVTLYIVDSGVRTTHAGFGGRAAGAFSAVDDGIPAGEDCHGHGTHVAGIAGSSPWGVAKNVNLRSVKALGCDARGWWSDYAEALDWIIANGVRPAVINASIGGSFDTAAAEAIAAAVAAGFTFVGAAGNADADACFALPGAVSAGITVGNVDSGDVRAFDSNWGDCVDIFAPGYAIESASAASDTGGVVMSGTSMAAPHVAGAAALYLQRFPAATPDKVRSEIARGATRGGLQGINAGSPNVLLFTPYLGDTVLPTVVLTSPATGVTVSGTITIAATASDNVALQGVGFFVGSTQIGFDTSAPYSVSWNSSAVTDGTYTVRARVVDLAGNSSDRTASVAVRNGIDLTLPTVAITEPTGGATIQGTITIRASAADDIGIARVEFLVDGAAIASDASAPYAASWSTAATPEGTHTLTARAFDTSGNNRLSSAVVVEIDNIAPSSLPIGWAASDVGAVGLAGSTSVANGAYVLQAGGVDIWSTADAFHYAYRPWSGDGDIIARVASLPLPPGAAFAMAGVMFRESLAANARHAALLVATNGKLKFRRRTTVGGATLSDGPSEGSVTVPQWLKISRRGSVFTAYRSLDGTNWVQVGPAATLSLPGTLHVGVWGLRNGGTAPAEASITNVAINSTTGLLPGGWTNGDVGAVGVAGTAGYASGTFALQAGGTDIWASADAFHYAYRSLTGDGDIVARVATLPLPAGASFAMAGVMFRESLGATSRHAAVLVATSGKLKFRRRTATGGTTLSDGPSEGSAGVPHWLKLTRRGNVFTAFRSVDGSTWVQVGPPATLALPATLHVGIWALRNGETAPAQATISDVTVSAAVSSTANHLKLSPE